MDRILLSIESTDAALVQAVPGLATMLDGIGTVFVPLPAVRPQARTAPATPAIVVVALDDPTAATAVGDWVSIYLERYPGATLTCVAGQRSRRLDAAQLASARDALAELTAT